MSSRIASFIMLLVALFLVTSCNMAAQSSVAEPVEQISTPPPDITCDQLVTLAETSVGLVCNGIGRNQACYGNHLVSVGFRPDSDLKFVQAGDKVDLLSITRLSTSPLNMQTHDWGIAVIKAQANLPDALPGQNVTFLLYGDTTLDNPTADMHAVTVSTRIGSSNCTEVPDSAVLIQSPEGSQVAMNINGADVTLGSTAYVTASQETKSMTFAILEGQGIIAANGVTQVVNPGMQTGIQLGGADGLHADGPPSVPSPYDINLIGNSPVKLLDRQIVIPPPGQGGQAVTDTPTPIQQAVATTCAPRTDWPYHYVIQSGDFLSTIALKLNMRTDDLQTGNCIANPNQLIAGQSIMVPRPLPTNTPPPPTVTPTSAAMSGPNLRADSMTVYQGECTNIYWDVDNIKAVYFEGQGVAGHGSQQECLRKPTTYTLLVILLIQQD
ncbi:MAG: LysM domain-containing protein, partial [Chloroflexota bacterium]